MELISGDGGAGGGIYNTGTLSLTDDTVSGNTTGAGGAAANGSINASGDDNTLILGAGDGGAGGGIYNAGDPTVTNSTVAGNTTGAGGIFGSDAVTATGTGDTFDLGTGGVSGGGGGIDNAGPATVTATTVSGNTASSGSDYSFNGGALTLTDDIAGNSVGAGNCAVAGGTSVDGGYNLDSGTTCALSAPTDKSDVDPQLGSLQANGGPTETLAPAASSPVIDAVPAGTNGCGTTIKTDQRGAHRPQGSGCDIGAYETGDVSMQSLVATPKPAPSGSSLTYVATVANAGPVDATGASMQETLPGGVSFTSATASQGSCAMTATRVTCALGQMPPASTAKVIVIVQVTAGSGSKLSDTSTVSAATGDTIPGNDTKTVKVNVT